MVSVDYGTARKQKLDELSYRGGHTTCIWNIMPMPRGEMATILDIDESLSAMCRSNQCEIRTATKNYTPPNSIV
jgi:hypothetical protein